jgi:hypothetical protein
VFPCRAGASRFAPTYYPGVTSVADALPTNVGLQAEASNVDFILQLVPTARVSGTLMGPDGAPAAGGSVTLAPDDGTTSARDLGANYGSGIRPDGSFMITNVPPGRYTAFARGQDRRAQVPLFALQNVSVSGADVTGVALSLSPGQTVSGTVAVDAGSSAAGNLTRIRVSPRRSPRCRSDPPASGVLIDGSFSLTPVMRATTWCACRACRRTSRSSRPTTAAATWPTCRSKSRRPEHRRHRGRHFQPRHGDLGHGAG